MLLKRYYKVYRKLEPLSTDIIQYSKPLIGLGDFLEYKDPQRGIKRAIVKQIEENEVVLIDLETKEVMRTSVNTRTLRFHFTARPEDHKNGSILKMTHQEFEKKISTLTKSYSDFLKAIYKKALEESCGIITVKQIAGAISEDPDLILLYTIYKHLTTRSEYFAPNAFYNGIFHCRTKDDVKKITQTLKLMKNTEISETLLEKLQNLESRNVNFDDNERTIIMGLLSYCHSKFDAEKHHPYRAFFVENIQPLYTKEDFVQALNHYRIAPEFVETVSFINPTGYAQPKVPPDLPKWPKLDNPQKFNSNFHALNLKYPFLMMGKRITHGEPAFAIDDPSASEIDDAISYDPDSKWIHVHIADPTSFIWPGNPIDLMAMRRATNFYHITRMPLMMFPSEFTQNFSLKPGKHNLTFTFSFKIDDVGNLTDYKINPTICSDLRRITYARVDEILESETDDQNYSFFQNLQKIAQVLKEKRHRDNAFSIDLPKKAITIQYQEDKFAMPNIIVEDEKRGVSNDIVAEIMIMANHVASKYAAERRLPFMFRQLVGEAVDYEKLTKEYYEISDPESRSVFLVQNYMAFPVSFDLPNLAGHSALGLSSYSRVTSPLRRYVDIIHHYQLKNYLMKDAGIYNWSDLRQIQGPLNVLQRSSKMIEKKMHVYWILNYLRIKNLRNEEIILKAIRIKEPKGLVEGTTSLYYMPEVSLLWRLPRYKDDIVNLKVKYACPHKFNLGVAMK
jgi:hypothetical protein